MLSRCYEVVVLWELPVEDIGSVWKYEGRKTVIRVRGVVLVCLKHCLDLAALVLHLLTDKSL